jgi:membrane peptidoglycan carboxypeptidase
VARKSARLTVILIVGIPLAGGVAAAAMFWLLLHGDLPGTVPEPNEIIRSRPSQVYDAQGNLIGEFREYDLTVDVTADDIPRVLKDAVVAAEDRNFWVHEGVDPAGVVRAAVQNYEEGETVQGGSTITQQYIKAQFLTNERSIERKLTEVILATRLEEELGKDEILFRYLDTTYFGGGAYGIGAAAQTYFRKSVKDLTIGEAALLASVIPAPTRFEPRRDPFGAEKRRQEVLDAMYEEGYITIEEMQVAKLESLWFTGSGPANRPVTLYYPAPEVTYGTVPYFLDYVRTYLEERYGHEMVYRGGLRIEATIDPNLQVLAEQAVAENLAGTQAPLEMSLVSLDPRSGHVKAMVGGRDWNASQVNLGTGGILGMQAGSAFKPFTLATAFEQGYTPDRIYAAPGVWTVPGCGTPGQCSVKNYSGGGYGSLSLEKATHASVNTVFAQLINDVGPNNVAALANRVGVTRIDPSKQYGISLTLGAYEVSPLDMAAGFATFANSGVRAPATPVARVTDPEGKVIEDNTGQRGLRVLNPAVADWTTQVLRGVITSGTGKRANIDRPAAGKTGTAQDYRAAWFIGYTPQLSTAVWMGYSDSPRALRNIDGFSVVTGGTIPARTWAAFMGPAHEGVPVLDFVAPGVLPAPNGDVPVDRADRSAPFVLRSEGCGGAECAPLQPGELVPTPPTTPPRDPEIDDEGRVEGSPSPEPVLGPG